MHSQSRTIYYLHKLEEFAEPIRDDRVVRMDAALVIFKGVYIGQSDITPAGMERGKLSLSQNPTHTLLRPVPSSDGPPFWSAIVYRRSGNAHTTVNLRVELPNKSAFFSATPEQAWVYHADPPGGPDAWETDISLGKSGYFLTGGFGLNALWRITRIQADALNRQVLTFAPVQLTPTLAIPLFETVGHPLREFLTEHFEGFQQAVTRNAHFDAIDRANNLTEGILSHCLAPLVKTPPKTLDKKLTEARQILENKEKRKVFALTHYGYHLAHQIRILHARLHENQSVGEGKTVRPEVGLNLTVTVSELLVEVGLGKY
jgi:hypothetical protein